MPLFASVAGNSSETILDFGFSILDFRFWIEDSSGNQQTNPDFHKRVRHEDSFHGYSPPPRAFPYFCS
jgi:hypothetical protein